MQNPEDKYLKTSNHPPGLSYLFFTEMWERFSYYGMRAILVLYIVKHLEFSDRDAGQIYGAYTGLVYLTPLLGGYLADKYLGSRNSIFLGAIVMAIGHLFLAIDSIPFFLTGLLFLVLGNGFFKPNVSSLVGRLYDSNPKQKDSGYTIFYMGINLGGFLGPLVCGSLGEKIDWHLGFGSAALGMCFGILIFYLGRNLFLDPVRKPEKNPNLIVTKIQTSESHPIGILDRSNLSHPGNIWAIYTLSFFSIFFWVAFEQAGSSMNLFADRVVDRNLWGKEIPASLFQALNPVFILLLAPVFAFLWRYLGSRDLEPDTSAKFAIGLALLGFGFLSLVAGSYQVDQYGTCHFGWLVMAYFMNTLGELCISPVGLSLVSRLAPKDQTGFYMGIWFFSTALAHYIAGFLAGISSDFGFTSYFFYFVILSFASGLTLLLLRKRIQTWIHIQDK